MADDEKTVLKQKHVVVFLNLWVNWEIDLMKNGPHLYPSSQGLNWCQYYLFVSNIKTHLKKIFLVEQLF